MRIMVQIVLVSVGGALGSLARWGVTIAFARSFGTAFPWGTLCINLSGSLFLGWFSTLLTDRLLENDNGWIRADDLRLLIAVGFTGAYTTFSTFEYESNQLIKDNDNWKALAYIIISVTLGLIAVRFGTILARMM